MGTRAEGRYDLRPASTADDAFLVRAHHTGLRPWVEATWGWDEVAQDAFAREWLAGRDDDTQVVGVAGEDAGYLVLHRTTSGSGETSRVAPKSSRPSVRPSASRK